MIAPPCPASCSAACAASRSRLCRAEGIGPELRTGERLGLIGSHGSGKSTFVTCISGGFAPHVGRVTLAGRSPNGLKPHRRARPGLAAEAFEGTITGLCTPKRR